MEVIIMTVRTTGEWAGANHVQAICHTENRFVVTPKMLEGISREFVEQMTGEHDATHDVEIILQNRVAQGVYKPT